LSTTTHEINPTDGYSPSVTSTLPQPQAHLYLP